MPVLVLRDLDFGIPWVLCNEPSILETGIKVHRPDDDSRPVTDNDCRVLDVAVEDTNDFTMKSLILAQDER